MADGDVMLDDAGDVILDDAGNVLLDDGAGCVSCCVGVDCFRRARRCFDGTITSLTLPCASLPASLYYAKRDSSGFCYYFTIDDPTVTTEGTPFGAFTPIVDCSDGGCIDSPDPTDGGGGPDPDPPTCAVRCPATCETVYPVANTFAAYVVGELCQTSCSETCRSDSMDFDGSPSGRHVLTLDAGGEACEWTGTVDNYHRYVYDAPPCAMIEAGADPVLAITGLQIRLYNDVLIGWRLLIVEGGSGFLYFDGRTTDFDPCTGGTFTNFYTQPCCSEEMFPGVNQSGGSVALIPCA